MSSVNGNTLYYIARPTRWSRGIGAALPEAYKKFWKEWKLTTPSPVHYIAEKGLYKRNEKTGEVHPVQNVPLPCLFPKELHRTITGGEAIIQGYKKKGKYCGKVPHFWFPTLKESVVYSEILDKYLKVVITDRTLDLIHENHGFDHYLLKYPACDLRSELAVGLKRQLLTALADKTLYPEDPGKREQVYNTYKDYLRKYTREEIEWYGLSYAEALKKYLRMQEEKNKIVPLKTVYRDRLVAGLKILKESGYKITEDTPVTVLAREALASLEKGNVQRAEGTETQVESNRT